MTVIHLLGAEITTEFEIKSICMEFPKIVFTLFA